MKNKHLKLVVSCLISLLQLPILIDCFSKSVSQSSNSVVDGASYSVSQTTMLSRGQVPDIFQQTLNRNGSDHSTSHGDYFFSDHASVALAQHGVTEDIIDNVTVEEIIWKFENRIAYQHSFVILKAPMTLQEKLLFPNLTHKFYVTEKNDLGIIWQLFYTMEEAENVKTEHDGHKWNRKRIHTLKTKHLAPRNKYTIADLKKEFNLQHTTHYHLLLKNCNWYARDIYNTLKGGQIHSTDPTNTQTQEEKMNKLVSINIVTAQQQMKKQEKKIIFGKGIV
eukprot:403347492